jgi:hypothetical protein
MLEDIKLFHEKGFIILYFSKTELNTDFVLIIKLYGYITSA